jgi:hypothetical protein
LKNPVIYDYFVPMFQENCAVCAHCLDMKRYGGQNKLHQACLARRCESLQPAANKKVRERWSTLEPHSSGGASSHSEGEQQLHPTATHSTGRKRAGNSRRSAPALRGREEQSDDDSEGESAARKGTRRPARKLLLTVTQQDDTSPSPAVIRNLADVKKGEERVRAAASSRGVGSSAAVPGRGGDSTLPVIGVPAGLSSLLAKVKAETKPLER